MSTAERLAAMWKRHERCGEIGGCTLYVDPGEYAPAFCEVRLMRDDLMPFIQAGTRQQERERLREAVLALTAHPYPAKPGFFLDREQVLALFTAEAIGRAEGSG